ncbi:protein-disulfide reductase DsbD N-terminal domain-containing protein [bacterium]|nr:protein-disulfide reductase DsbD N-terminal domain-containing protein [bacterium]MBU1675397.1 protein-disulfide reductase DsbD N-terminal domain-containing protein [bacterium]
MRPVLITAVLLLAAIAAVGQGMRDSSSVVSVRAPAAVSADVGETVSITVGIDIDKGWHLYAHGDTVYYGISVTGLDTVPLAAVAVDYPAGHRGKFLGETVTLLAGKEELTITGVLMAELDAPLAFELECQACDAKSCLAPAWIPFEVAVRPKE